MEPSQLFSSPELQSQFAAEYSQWTQRKRPAIPPFRAALAKLATQLRAKRGYSRMMLLERYRGFRAFLVEVDAEEEREFWMLLKRFGLGPEGGVQ